MSVAGRPVVSALVRRLTDLGQTVACAESLTAGLLCARIADVPGASLVLRGGVVAYAPQLKTSILGIDPALIRAHGTVHPDVAAAMARGARERLGADWGMATTGVAGPGPAEGHPAGTVWVAVAGPEGERTKQLAVAGERAEVRRATVEEVLLMLWRSLPVG